MQLNQILCQGRAVALTGLPGIGKTQLALAYARTHRHDHTASLWVDASSADNICQYVAALANVLELPEYAPDDQKRALAAVHTWMTSHDGWLLVLDNADDLKLAMAQVPPGHHGRILLTTTSHAVGELIEPLVVPLLDPPVAISFLLGQPRVVTGKFDPVEVPVEERKAAQALAEELAYLPLALAQARAFIEQSSSTLAEYLDLYREQGVQLRDQGSVLTAYHQSVTKTFLLTFNKIAENTPAAADLLRLCAFLHPDQIPHEILVLGAAELGEQLALALSTHLGLVTIRAAACRYSLMAYDGSRQYLSIHRLVQQVLKDLMTPEEQSIWAERAVRALNRCFPEVRFHTWAACERLMPQAQVCATHVRARQMTSAEARRLLHQTAAYLYQTARFDQAARILEYAVVTIETTLGEHPELVICLNHLAAIYYSYGKYLRSERLYTRSLEVARKVLKPHHADLATIYEGLAALRERQGKVTEAEELYLQSLAIREALTRNGKLSDPEDCAVTAITHNNLAVLYEAQGRYDEAERHCRQALSIQESVLSPEHPNIAISLNNLAAISEARRWRPCANSALPALQEQPVQQDGSSGRDLAPPPPVVTTDRQRADASFGVNAPDYDRVYEYSISDPEGFWAGQANRFVTWFRGWNQVLSTDEEKGDVRWFLGAKLNISYNCLDRHLEARGDQVAIIWEGDEPREVRKITYAELYDQVCRFANALKALGISIGSRVLLCLPMIPELVVSMLACARIGAVHVMIPSGFSTKRVGACIADSGCTIVVTADEAADDSQRIASKRQVDEACKEADVSKGACAIRRVIVVRRTGGDISWKHGRDFWFHEVMCGAPADCPPEHLDAENLLFSLYIPAFRFKPTSVQYTTGGYLVYAASTHKYVFDYLEGDIYWCAVDMESIGGHSYVCYGPLCNGATTVMFEGSGNYPSASRLWEVADSHHVTVFSTSSTTVHRLMRERDSHVSGTHQGTIRLLGIIGDEQCIEPLALEWYYYVIGKGHCALVNTCIQTEVGGVLMMSRAGSQGDGVASALFPCFGVRAALVDKNLEFLNGAAPGNLVITLPLPGLGERTDDDIGFYRREMGIYHIRDAAKRDKNGYYRITNVDGKEGVVVCGRRIGYACIEEALARHPEVGVVSAVGVPDDIKGESIYVFVSLMGGAERSEGLRQEMRNIVLEQIGPVAAPDAIQFASGLVYTRSGKLVRSILRAIAAKNDVPHVNTLGDPEVVDDLIRDRSEIDTLLLPSVAEPLYGRALKILEDSLYPEQPILAVVLSNIAYEHYQHRRYDDAVQLYLRALAIQRRIFGQRHPDIARTLNSLGLLYDSQHRDSEAQSLFRQAREASDTEEAGGKPGDSAAGQCRVFWRVRFPPE